jgi:alkylation response protein AidB-like acyl-CoA dehydrogenase
MAADKGTTEQESREVAEAARETEWADKGFMREVFLGNLRVDWVHPYPETELRPKAREFYAKMKAFLENEVDSPEIDRTGEYPPHVIDGLRKLGAFGMKIAEEYGGLGFNQVEYTQALEMIGQYDANVIAVLSAHQSIGLPQPLKIFGSEAQKKKYLPRCAAGAISAFALTEAEVGSDPARLSTTATKTPEGDYILNGEKLWCTNGTFAELLVVMARDPETKKISTFIVEANAPGVEVVYRCRFMGLRALENGIIRFKDVRVSKEDLIGKEGMGLKIALVTLNTGRLSLPATCVGFTKKCIEICREWSNQRVQWGAPIGKHEAITHKLADMGATVYAMESMTDLASEFAMRKGYDIRLEAAACKEWGTVRAWHLVDETMQIRGGRGYETEISLKGRGEKPIGVERIMRDCRINLIFEGSSEIMHLFMAREAVDKHLQIAGAMIDPKKTIGQKLALLPKIIFFYAWWYPTRFIGWSMWPKYSEFGRLGRHLRFAERATRKLGRSIFHGMLRFGPKLEKRQGFLFRLVDIANEIFALTAAISRAEHLRKKGDASAASAAELADLFARSSRRNIRRWFHELWANDDTYKYEVGANLLKGRHDWLEYVEAGEEVSGEVPALPSSGPRPAQDEPREVARSA